MIVDRSSGEAPVFTKTKSTLAWYGGRLGDAEAFATKTLVYTAKSPAAAVVVVVIVRRSRRNGTESPALTAAARGQRRLVIALLLLEVRARALRCAARSF